MPWTNDTQCRPIVKIPCELKTFDIIPHHTNCLLYITTLTGWISYPHRNRKHPPVLLKCWPNYLHAGLAQYPWLSSVTTLAFIISQFTIFFWRFYRNSQVVICLRWIHTFLLWSWRVHYILLPVIYGEHKRMHVQTYTPYSAKCLDGYLVWVTISADGFVLSFQKLRNMS